MNPTKSSAIISLRNVSQVYPSGVTALQHISFDIAATACVLITGHSGAGKSSLLKIIRGDINPTGGEVLVHDFLLKDFNGDDKTLLRQSTGYLDQDPQFIGSLTVIENLKFFAEMGADTKLDIHDLLRKVGLDFVEHMYPAELSRGQRQIIQVIRAVIHQPFLLIADEPIAHLDEALVQIVMQLFRELQQAGTTLVIATHRVDPFTTFANRVHIQLNKGQMV
jgi:cell division transport system ATP-binding protein